MPNPLSSILQKPIGQKVLGFAQDFWKDPDVDFPTLNIKLGPKTVKIPNLLKPTPVQEEPAAMAQATTKSVAVAAGMPAAATSAAAATAPQAKWHALPGELSEKMWGEGQTLPAGNAIMEILVAPLNLARDKNVLDLTAGLGGPLRLLSNKVNQLKGFEIDPAIAARGMEMSTKDNKAKLAPIEAYNPATFSMPTIYDAMISRELFYRVADRDKFIYSISAGIKLQGSAVFSDYIVDPENRDKEAIKTWQAREQGAKPLGLIEMAEAWAKVGFELKRSDDQTVMYRREVVNGINRFMLALKSSPPPDAETKKAILNEVETWVYRLAAIQQGMKFYCFQAFKS